MDRSIGLQNLRPGETAVVESLNSSGALRRRLLDMGLVEGTRVECLGLSPAGDPRAFLIRGAMLAIRSGDCRDIIVNKV
ncbi:MAG TPA: ferrous iron transport protein A [Candidatus Limivicinus faecipullorum]|nr:ferrous iron transport protein A [Candidatus Limivicinus faecipullorum]